MTYVDTLLTAKENVIYRTRKHWIAPILVALPASAAIVGGVVVMLLHRRLRDVTFIGPLTSWIGWLAILIGIVWLADSFTRWYTMEYVVTNEKVIKAWGRFRKNSESASLEKINEISMQQPVIGRLLDFGTLQVRTASDSADLRYWFMEAPQEFRRHILESKQLYERADAEHIARALGTELSEPVPGVTETPQAPPHVAAKSPTTAVPELISQLAALRDQGVLTESEFQTKKSELLGRL